MVEHQPYISSSSLSHQGDLTGPHGISENDRAPATLPTTTAFADVSPFSAVRSTPYSTSYSASLPTTTNLRSPTVPTSQNSQTSQVSPYSLSHQCDPSLLTPISTVGSPPLTEIRKPVRQQYPPPPGAPYAQVPTPPGSSKMYHQWSSHQFDMNSQASQSSSPMNNSAPPVGQDFYVDERRTPAPPEPYLGSYGVSEAHEPQGMHHQQHAPYYIQVPVEPQNSILMRDHQVHMPMDRNAPHAPPPSLPSQSHHVMYRPHDRDVTLINRSPTQGSPDGRRRAAGAQSGPRGGVRKPAKLPSKGRAGARSNAQLDRSEEHKNCYGQEIPPTLKSTCPEEERCIFESRWRHRAKRGADMWDSIQADFYKKFGKQHGKEMLQMKFKRGRAKYLQWPERDDQLVIDAFKKLEKNRYQLMLNYFIEMGGSRNMLLSASDIEIKLVNDLKLEENIYIEAAEGLEVRRRRKVALKKRPGGRGEPISGEILGRDDLLNVMSHNSLTEDDVINQVYERRDRWEEASPSSNGGNMMDVPMWDSRAPMKNSDSAPMIPPQPGHLLKTAYNHNGTTHAGNPHSGTHLVGAPTLSPQSLYHRRK